jgi:hypothetical protein
MTNKTAIIFGILLLGAIAYDIVANGSSNLIFLGKYGLRLLEWLAVWR